MRFEHARLPVEDERVAEAGDLHLVPGLAEHDVALQDLIFEGSPEASLTCPFLHVLLDLTADTTDCADLCACELSDLELAIEHALDEGGVLVDLKGLTDKLELLHDLELGVHLYNSTSHADSEMRDILALTILQFLHTNEGSTHGISWSVEGGIAEAEFRCILKLSKPLSLNVICAVDRHCLELPPTN